MNWSNIKQTRRIAKEIGPTELDESYTGFETEITRTKHWFWYKKLKPMDPMTPTFFKLLTPKEVSQQYLSSKIGSRSFQFVRDEMRLQEKAVREDMKFWEGISEEYFEGLRELEEASRLPESKKDSEAHTIASSPGFMKYMKKTMELVQICLIEEFGFLPHKSLVTCEGFMLYKILHDWENFYARSKRRVSGLGIYTQIIKFFFHRLDKIDPSEFESWDI